MVSGLMIGELGWKRKGKKGKARRGKARGGESCVGFCCRPPATGNVVVMGSRSDQQLFVFWLR